MTLSWTGYLLTKTDEIVQYLTTTAMRTTTKSTDLISKKQICTCSAHFWTFSCRCFARLTHQSIPVVPSTLPPPPWLLRGCCPPCQSRGWGIANFALPWGRAFANRAFDKLVVSYQNITTQKILLEIQADWLICQWREIAKACSRFYAFNSSLLIKPELHGKIGSYTRESTFLWLWNQFCWYYLKNILSYL